MIAHTHLHVSDFERSKAFYLKVLAPLGYSISMEVGDAAGFFDGKNTDLWVVNDPVVPTHIAFEAEKQGRSACLLRGGAAGRGGR